MTVIIHTLKTFKHKKRKPTKVELEAAAEAAKARAWLESLPKFARGGRVAAPKHRAPVPTPAERPASLVTPGGSTAKKPPPQYTGNQMLGIAQLHKSNAVPVFTDEEIKDISKMRRG